MPQLDFATFPPQLIWLAITFVALYLLMTRVGLPKVGGIIEERQSRIETDLEKAAQINAEAKVVLAAYEKALADARQEAQATMRESMERAAAENAARQRELAKRLDAETDAAERRIVAAKAEAMASVRAVAADLAADVAAKLTGAEVSASRAGVAVDAVLKERSLA